MESNKRQWVLPPLKIKPILPPRKKYVSEPKLKFTNESKTDIFKASSVQNRKIIIKLNSIKFGNLIRENIQNTRMMYPSIYSSTLSLISSETPGVSNQFSELKLEKYKFIKILSKNSLLVELLGDTGELYIFKKLIFLSEDNQKNLEKFEKLKHISLNSIYEYISSKSIYYITSKYSNLSLENFNFSEFIIKYPNLSFIDMFKQCLNACQYLHENDILHANIKPSNFLLDTQGQIKVADYGYFNLTNNKINYLVKLMNDPIGRLYIPIETFRDFKYTNKSDLYAVAALFYQIITNKNFKYSFENVSYEELNDSLKNEAFSDCLISLLNNYDTERADCDQILLFVDFEKNLKILENFSTNSQLILKGDKKLVWKKFRTQSLEIKENLLKLKDIDHGNLIQVAFYLSINNNYYVCRDFIEDYVNLDVKLKLSNLTETILVDKWLAQILNGLSALNKLGIKHGNLKMTNILVKLDNDLIKLTDFGYLNFLNEDQEVICDIFDLGKVIYKCICLEDYSEDDSFLTGRFKESNFSENLKNCVVNMLSPNRDLRPNLSNLLDAIFNPIFTKLKLNSFKSISLHVKSQYLVPSENNFFAVTNYKKSKKVQNYFGYKIRVDKMTKEKLNLNLCQTQKLKCKCESESTRVTIPKIFCALTNGYILGCNSDYFYLINEQFLCVKLMCLIEILEEDKHTTLINRSNLRLNSESMVYDAGNSKLYLLVTVHMKFYFLNIFNCDLIKSQKEVQFSLSVIKMLHINILDTSKNQSKKMVVNENFIFISDQSTIRAFNKENLKYLFTLNCDVRTSNLVVEQAKYIGAFRSEVLNDQNELIEGDIQNLCVDSKGCLYVAFNYMIKCYDHNGQFLWKYKFSKSTLSGKITNVCFNKLDNLALIVQDDKNENSSRFLFFS
ncbi:unnamed protein product [Brachionus calyciflorus]|uniref:Protein kinase domain-containing protein n=1 Tax=Brachionus calyciflorus TaxID=104777 RepID=A0A813UN60_9BILA|nr:unnamed protein product [Brachionus calyciflorus]